MQCGHTYPNFFNQGEEVARVVLGHPVVPFEFRWLDQRMVVTRSYLDTADLVPGTEVLTIDGRPVADILAALLPYSRADGGNDAKRVRNLEVQGHGEYEAFDVYFPLVFPRDESQPFALQVRGPADGEVRALQAAAINRAQRVVVQGSPRDDGNPWTYREVKPGVGLLVMPTWALYNSKFAWESVPDFADRRAERPGHARPGHRPARERGRTQRRRSPAGPLHRATAAGRAGAAQDPLSHGAGRAATVPGDLGQVVL